MHREASGSSKCAGLVLPYGMRKLVLIEICISLYPSVLLSFRLHQSLRVNFSLFFFQTNFRHLMSFLGLRFSSCSHFYFLAIHQFPMQNWEIIYHDDEKTFYCFITCQYTPANVNLHQFTSTSISRTVNRKYNHE